jgi:hypothetical protein
MGTEYDTHEMPTWMKLSRRISSLITRLYAFCTLSNVPSCSILSSRRYYPEKSVKARRTSDENEVKVYVGDEPSLQRNLSYISFVPKKMVQMLI